MGYPASTPMAFSGARQLVEQQGIVVWLELGYTVLPDTWFNVTEVAGKLECLRQHRNQ